MTQKPCGHLVIRALPTAISSSFCPKKLSLSHPLLLCLQHGDTMGLTLNLFLFFIATPNHFSLPKVPWSCSVPLLAQQSKLKPHSCSPGHDHSCPPEASSPSSFAIKTFPPSVAVQFYLKWWSNVSLPSLTFCFCYLQAECKFFQRESKVLPP